MARKTPVSPKVTSATIGASAATVAGYLLEQVPFIAHAPQQVQSSLLILVIAAGTFGAGYIKRDPDRF